MKISTEQDYLQSHLTVIKNAHGGRNSIRYQIKMEAHIDTGNVAILSRKPSSDPDKHVSNLNVRADTFEREAQLIHVSHCLTVI